MPGKAVAGSTNPPKKNKKCLPNKRKTSCGSRRSRSSLRPTTRRNPEDSPTKSRSLERIEITGKKNPSISFAAQRDSLTVVQTESMQRILQFSLRITEDIIKNDMYSNQDMMAVLRAHYQDNKGTLDEDKMLVAIAELCRELNIPFDIRGFEDNMGFYQSPKTPETLAQKQCICAPPAEIVYSEICECGVPRPPPITCSIHEEALKEEVEHKESPMKKERHFFQKECIVEVESGGEEEKRKEEERKKKEEKKKEEQMRRQEERKKEEQMRRDEEENRRREEERINEEEERRTEDDDTLGTYSDRSPELTDSKEKTTPDVFPMLMDLMNQEEIASPQSTRKKTRCTCGSDSCDPSVCDAASLDSEIIFLINGEMEAMDEEMEEPEIFPEYGNEVIEPAIDEPEPSNESLEPTVVTKDQTCICNGKEFAKDKLLSYLDYFEQRMGHTKHLRALDFCHHLTTIEPMRVETHDLSVQTSTDHIYKPTKPSCSCSPPSTNYRKCQPPNIEPPCKKIPVTIKPKQIDQQTECNNCAIQFEVPKAPSDDFVVISGPIFIPKDIAKSGKGIAALFQPPHSSPILSPSNNCQSTRQVTPKSCTRSTSYQYSTQNLDCACSPRQDPCPKVPKELYPRTCQPNIFHYNEYDLTPQRDTFHSEEKRNNCCCDFQRDNATLLLGNTYNKLMMPRDECHLSLYYPTTATQVSSTDLMKYISVSKKEKPKVMPIPKAPEYVEPIKPVKVSISLNDYDDDDDDDDDEDQEIMAKLDEVCETPDPLEDEESNKSSTNNSEYDIQKEESEPLVRDRAVSVSINADVDIITDSDSKKQSGYANRVQMRK